MANNLPFEIKFTHIDPDTKAVTVIAMTKLLQERKLKRLPLITIGIDPEWAKTCLSDRGIEQHRLQRLMEVEDQYDPILHVHWGDGTKLQVDGVHRYVASWLRGRKTIRTKVVPLSVWRPYVMTGLRPVSEEQLQNSFSGIY